MRVTLRVMVIRYEGIQEFIAQDELGIPSIPDNKERIRLWYGPATIELSGRTQTLSGIHHANDTQSFPTYS